MTYVVVSGLPASGKSALARRLAPALARPILDKDDILDRLFESEGVGDASWRARLSRAADDIFRRVAPTLDSALLVSWWRHPLATTESGTPTAWLSTLAPGCLELHCVCPPAVAAARFAARTRHAGHLDATRPLEALLDDFERFARLGPLECGPVLCVDTEREDALDDVVAFVVRNGVRPQCGVEFDLIDVSRSSGGS